METAWKDQDVLLLMTTVDKTEPTILRLHRRPAKTATNSHTLRAVFGKAPVKELPIPLFIDGYNHFNP